MESEQKTVAIHTLGCRLNFSESGELAQQFASRGYLTVPFGEKADVSFINTCTVTDDADSSCRNLIRKAHRVSPEGKIVVAGCYAQMDPERIASMQGVDLVLGLCHCDCARSSPSKRDDTKGANIIAAVLDF